MVSSTDPRRPLRRRACALACAVFALAVGPTRAASVILQAAADTTLYEEGDWISNGMGQHFFAGTNGFNSARRALIRFAVEEFLPGGATVTSAELTLNLSRTISGPRDVALHRLLELWGEGASDAVGNEGFGAQAQDGDATWVFRVWPGVSWATPGGSWIAAPSANLPVGGPCIPENGQTAACGKYRWGTAGTAADVQAWLDDPAQNFGWILVGVEASSDSAKRFDSRTHPTASVRPILRVVYTAPVPAGAVPDGNLVAGEPLLLAKLGGDELGLTWSPSCVGTDLDYEIYSGAIGAYAGHTPLTCTTAGATAATLSLSGPSEYYLIAPRNGVVEGSYGVDSDGNPRPAFPATSCLPRAAAPCL